MFQNVKNSKGGVGGDFNSTLNLKGNPLKRGEFPKQRYRYDMTATL